MGIHIDHWVGNVVKCAGRDIGKATTDFSNAAGKVGKDLSKVPVVGGVLHALYDAAFEGTFGLLIMTEQVTVQGERVDRVVLTHLKSQLADFKEIGPYAQMVLSFIPGVGQGISAAIGCGLALANGQPIGKALMAGVKGAIPGGPLAQMAFEAATDTATAVIEHRKVSFASVAEEGIDVVAAGVNLPIPDIAKRALEGGLKCAGALCAGKPLEKALVTSFASELPIPDAMKQALSQVTGIANDLTAGIRSIDGPLMAELSVAVKNLPSPPNVQASILDMKGVASVHGCFGVEDPKAKALAIRINHAVTDVFLDHAKGHMNKTQSDSITVALAMVQGKNVQGVTAPQLAPDGPVVGKLITQGRALIATDEVLKAGYETLPDGPDGKQGTKGFQIGAAMSRKQCNAHQVLAIRSGLSGEDKRGFDIACSLHVGRVAHPPPKRILGKKAKAGYYATLGMQGAPAALKTGMMKVIASDPLARLGAKTAVSKIVERREGWWDKVRRYLGAA